MEYLRCNDCTTDESCIHCRHMIDQFLNVLSIRERDIKSKIKIFHYDVAYINYMNDRLKNIEQRINFIKTIESSI
jgi:hypothetical protein